MKFDNRIGQKNTITAAMLRNRNVMRTLPRDLHDDIQVGCITWRFCDGNYDEGRLTRWPDGRGAMSFDCAIGNDPSMWGWWEGDVLLRWGEEKIDEYGDEIEDDEDDDSD